MTGQGDSSQIAVLGIVCNTFAITGAYCLQYAQIWRYHLNVVMVIGETPILNCSGDVAHQFLAALSHLTSTLELTHQLQGLYTLRRQQVEEVHFLH